MQKKCGVMFGGLFVFAACNTASPAIVVKSVEASQTLQVKQRARFAATNLIDKTNRSWCEGAQDFGKDVYLSFQFEKPQKVRSIFIRNGYGWGQYWADNNRVRELRIERAGAESTVVALQDTDELQELRLPNPLQSDGIKMKIESVYPGSKANDTCLAEVAFNKQEDYDTSFTLELAKTDWRILERVADRFWGVIRQQSPQKHMVTHRIWHPAYASEEHVVEEYRIQLSANGRLISKELLRDETIERIIAFGDDLVFMQQRPRKFAANGEEYRSFEPEFPASYLVLVNSAGREVRRIQPKNRRVKQVLRTGDKGLLLVSGEENSARIHLTKLDSSGGVLWQKSILETYQLPDYCREPEKFLVSLRGKFDDSLIVTFACPEAKYSHFGSPPIRKLLVLALDQRDAVEWQQPIEHKNPEKDGTEFSLHLNGIAPWQGQLYAIGDLNRDVFTPPVTSGAAYIIGPGKTTMLPIRRVDPLFTEEFDRSVDWGNRYEQIFVSADGALSIYVTSFEHQGENAFDLLASGTQRISYFALQMRPGEKKFSWRAALGQPFVVKDDKIVIYKSDTTRRKTEMPEENTARFEPGPVQKIFKVTRDGRMLDL